MQSSAASLVRDVAAADAELAALNRDLMVAANSLALVAIELASADEAIRRTRCAELRDQAAAWANLVCGCVCAALDRLARSLVAPLSAPAFVDPACLLSMPLPSPVRHVGSDAAGAHVALVACHTVGSALLVGTPPPSSRDDPLLQASWEGWPVDLLVARWLNLMLRESGVREFEPLSQGGEGRVIENFSSDMADCHAWLALVGHLVPQPSVKGSSQASQGLYAASVGLEFNARCACLIAHAERHRMWPDGLLSAAAIRAGAADVTFVVLSALMCIAPRPGVRGRHAAMPRRVAQLASLTAAHAAVTAASERWRELRAAARQVEVPSIAAATRDFIDVHAQASAALSAYEISVQAGQRLREKVSPERVPPP